MQFDVANWKRKNCHKSKTLEIKQTKTQQSINKVAHFFQLGYNFSYLSEVHKYENLIVKTL